MTQTEWLACTDPAEMLAFLRELGKLSERKARLFAAACCRHLWHMLNDSGREAVASAERYADGVGQAVRWVRRGREAFYRSQFYLDAAVEDAVRKEPSHCAGSAARSVLLAAYWTGREGYDRASIETRYAARETERARQLVAVHCVFGNPFQSVAVVPVWLRWNDGAVVKLAQAAYQKRQLPTAHLAILADALEEAGCNEADFLGHLRGPGPHTRGCWVVDLILDKK
jgi:hypothetical protein